MSHAAVRRLALALLAAAPLLALGCLESIGETDLIHASDRLELDPGRLRPDFQPLGSQPPSGRRETYSNGNVYDENGQLADPGAAPLSPLLFGDIEESLVPQLRRAECLWVDRGNESARVSFEAIAYGVAIDELDGVVAEMSSCGGYINDPVTRHTVVQVEDMDPSDMDQLIGEASPWLDVEAVLFEGRATPDPYHACDAGDAGIAGQPARRVNLRGRLQEPFQFPSSWSHTPRAYPFCANQAALARLDQDTSIELRMLNVDTGDTLESEGANAPPFEVPTRVKVVEPSSAGDEFLISRPLEFVGPREVRVDGSRTITPMGWTWRAPLAADGRWSENFSPNLAISRIRVFRDGGVDPDTGELVREYLSPGNVDAYSDPALRRGDRELRCDFDPEDGDGPEACVDTLGFVPTYRIDRQQVGTRLSDLLSWVVEFDRVVECEPVTNPDGTMDCNDVVVEEPPVEEGDRDVYLEFHLVRPGTGTSSQGLSVRPAANDFGDVRADTGPEFQDVFTVHNWGQGRITLTEVELQGPDAGMFEILGGGGAIVGRQLDTGDSLSVGVRVVGSSLHYGRREASLRVVAADLQGRSMSVRGELRATVVDWIFEAVHQPFHFLRSTGQDPWDDVQQWQKALLITNAGWVDMPRTRITITGPGAEHFSVVRAESEHLAPEDYVPWIRGEEPPRENAIAPGSSELFYVVYHPDVPYPRTLQHGDDRADLRFLVGEAEYRIPVAGTCVGTCQFRAPSPVAPPSDGGDTVKVVPGPYAPAIGSGGILEVESLLAR